MSERPRARATADRLPGRLLVWGRTVELATDGADFSQDPDKVLEVLRVNPAAAFRLAVAALESLLVLKPDRLHPDSAENLCRLLVPLADTLRVRGDRNSACDLLDLAFHIEGQLESAELRAFIYRISSFLLSDLGYLPDAEDFAVHSLDLATSSADLEGIGRSWYIRGVMADRQGILGTAIDCYRSCLRYQQWLTVDVRLAAQLELAMVHLELGDVIPARGSLEAALPEVPVDGVFGARLLRIKAELAALEDRTEEAQALFKETEEAYAALDFVPDIVIVRLEHIELLLRQGRVLEASALARQLIPLASQFHGNRATEALLLGLARAAFQGRLVLDSVAEAIKHCRRPWLAERFSYPTGSI